MLTRLPVLAGALTLLLVAVVALVPSPALAGASGVVCLMPDPETGHCPVQAQWEQGGGGEVSLSMPEGTGGGNLQTCTRPQRSNADASEGLAVVDCYGGERLGWYSHSYDCYFNSDVVSEIDLDRVEVRYQQGAQPGDDGAVYRAWCFIEHYSDEGGWFGYDYYFFPSPPDGYGGTPDPTAGLIVRAVNELLLRGPEIGTAPPNVGYGIVGMPVWLWTEVTPQTWGTQRTSVEAGDITVVAEATATQIDWHPGDGADPFPCGAGVSWRPGLDPLQPDCGHVYGRPSRDLPDGRYTITAVTTWEVDWSVSGGPNDGRGGTFTLTPQSETALRINEVQVLVTYE